MTKKQKPELENIMQDIRDFRDDVYCLSTDTDQPKDCTCVKYDEILDKLEIIKSD